MADLLLPEAEGLLEGVVQSLAACTTASPEDDVEALRLLGEVAELLGSMPGSAVEIDMEVLRSAAKTCATEARAAPMANVLTLVSRQLLQATQDYACDQEEIEGLRYWVAVCVVELLSGAGQSPWAAGVCGTCLDVLTDQLLRHPRLQGEVFETTDLASVLPRTLPLHALPAHLKLLSVVSDPRALRCAAASPLVRLVCDISLPQEGTGVLLSSERVRKYAMRFLQAASGAADDTWEPPPQLFLLACEYLGGDAAFDAEDKQAALQTLVNTLAKPAVCSALPSPKALHAAVTGGVEGDTAAHGILRAHCSVLLLDAHPVLNVTDSFEHAARRLVPCLAEAGEDTPLAVRAVRAFAMSTAAHSSIVSTPEIMSCIGAWEQDLLCPPLLWLDVVGSLAAHGDTVCAALHEQGWDSTVVSMTHGALEEETSHTPSLVSGMLCIARLCAARFEVQAAFVDHPYGIPLLLAVLSDPDDPSGLKTTACNIICSVRTQLCAKVYAESCAKLTTHVLSSLAGDSPRSSLVCSGAEALVPLLSVGAVAKSLVGTASFDSMSAAAALLGSHPPAVLQCFMQALLHTARHDPAGACRVLPALATAASQCLQGCTTSDAPVFECYIDCLSMLCGAEADAPLPAVVFSDQPPLAPFANSAQLLPLLPSGKLMDILSHLAAHRVGDLSLEGGLLLAHALRAGGPDACPSVARCLQAFPLQLVGGFSQHGGLQAALLQLTTAAEEASPVRQGLALQVLRCLHEVGAGDVEAAGLLAQGSGTPAAELLELMGADELLLRFDAAATVQQGSLRRTLDAWEAVSHFASASPQFAAKHLCGTPNALVSFLTTGERVAPPAFYYVIADLLRLDKAGWEHADRANFLCGVIAQVSAQNDPMPITDHMAGIAYLGAACVLQEAHVDLCIQHAVDAVLQRCLDAPQLGWGTVRRATAQDALEKLRAAKGAVLVARAAEEEEGARVMRDAGEGDMPPSTVLLDTPAEERSALAACAEVLCRKDYQFTQEEAELLAKPNATETLLAVVHEEALCAQRSDDELARVYACLVFAAQRDAEHDSALKALDDHVLLLHDPRGPRTLREACVYLAVLAWKDVPVVPAVQRVVSTPFAHAILLQHADTAEAALRLVAALLPEHCGTFMSAELVCTCTTALDQAVVAFVASAGEDGAHGVLCRYMRAVGSAITQGHASEAWVRQWAVAGACKKLLAALHRVEHSPEYQETEECVFAAMHRCTRWVASDPDTLLGPDWAEDVLQVIRLRWNAEGTLAGRHAAAVMFYCTTETAQAKFAEQMWDICAAAFRIDDTAPPLADGHVCVLLATPALLHPKVSGDAGHMSTIAQSLDASYPAVSRDGELAKVWLHAMGTAVRSGLGGCIDATLLRNLTGHVFASLTAAAHHDVTEHEHLAVLRNSLALLVASLHDEDMRQVTQETIDGDAGTIAALCSVLQWLVSDGTVPEGDALTAAVVETCRLLATVAHSVHFASAFHNNSVYAALATCADHFKESSIDTMSAVAALLEAAITTAPAQNQAAVVGDGTILVNCAFALRHHMGLTVGTADLQELAAALSAVTRHYPAAVESLCAVGDVTYLQHMQGALSRLLLSGEALPGTLHEAVCAAAAAVFRLLDLTEQLGVDTARYFFLVVAQLLQKGAEGVAVRLLPLVGDACLAHKQHALSILSPPRAPLAHAGAERPSVLSLLTGQQCVWQGLAALIEQIGQQHGTPVRHAFRDAYLLVLVQLVCDLSAPEAEPYLLKFVDSDVVHATHAVVEALAEHLGQRLLDVCSAGNVERVAVVTRCIAALPCNDVSLDYIRRAGALPDVQLQSFCQLMLPAEGWCVDPTVCRKVHAALQPYGLQETLLSLLEGSGDCPPSLAHTVLYSAACYAHGVTTVLTTPSVLAAWQGRATECDPHSPFIQALGYAYAVAILQCAGMEESDCGPFSIDSLVTAHGAEFVGIASQGECLTQQRRAECLQAIAAIRENERLKSFGDDLTRPEMVTELRKASAHAVQLQGQNRVLQKRVEELENAAAAQNLRQRAVEADHVQKVKQLHLEFEVTTAERQMDHQQEEKKMDDRYAALLAKYGNSDVQALRQKVDELQEALSESEAAGKRARTTFDERVADAESRHKNELRRVEAVYRQKETTVLAQRKGELERLEQDREDIREQQSSLLEERHDERTKLEKRVLEDRVRCTALEKRVKELAQENSRLSREVSEFSDRHDELRTTVGKADATWSEKLDLAVANERMKHDRSAADMKILQEQRLASVRSEAEQHIDNERLEHSHRMALLLVERDETDLRLQCLQERSAVMRALRREKEETLRQHREHTERCIVDTWGARLASETHSLQRQEDRKQRRLLRRIARLSEEQRAEKAMQALDTDAFLLSQEVRQVQDLVAAEQDAHTTLLQEEQGCFSTLEAHWLAVLRSEALRQRSAVEERVQEQFDEKLADFKQQWESYMKGREEDADRRVEEYREIAQSMSAKYASLEAEQQTQDRQDRQDRLPSGGTPQAPPSQSSSARNSSCVPPEGVLATQMLEACEIYARALIYDLHGTYMRMMPLIYTCSTDGAPHPQAPQAQPPVPGAEEPTAEPAACPADPAVAAAGGAPAGTEAEPGDEAAAPAAPRPSVGMVDAAVQQSGSPLLKSPELPPLPFASFKYILGRYYNTKSRGSLDDSVEYSYLEKLRCLFHELKSSEEECESEQQNLRRQVVELQSRPSTCVGGSQTEVLRPSTSDATSQVASATREQAVEAHRCGSADAGTGTDKAPAVELQAYEEYTITRQRLSEPQPCQKCTKMRASAEVIEGLVASHEEEVHGLKAALAAESARLDELKGCSGGGQDHEELKARFASLQGAHREAESGRAALAGEVKGLKEKIGKSAEQEASLSRRIDQFSVERVQIEQVLQANRAELQARSDEVEKLRNDARQSQEDSDSADVASLLRSNEELGAQVARLSNEVDRLRKRSIQRTEHEGQRIVTEQSLRAEGIESAVAAWKHARVESDAMHESYVEMKGRRDKMKKERDDANKELEIAMEREAASMAKYLRLLSAQHNIKHRERELGALAWQTITSETEMPEVTGKGSQVEAIGLTRKTSSKRRLEPIGTPSFAGSQWASPPLSRSDGNPQGTTLPPLSPLYAQEAPPQQTPQKSNVSRHVHGRTV